MILEWVCICYTYCNTEIQFPLQENKNLVTFIFGRNSCTAQLLQLNIVHQDMVCVTLLLNGPCRSAINHLHGCFIFNFLQSITKSSKDNEKGRCDNSASQSQPSAIQITMSTCNACNSHHQCLSHSVQTKVK